MDERLGAIRGSVDIADVKDADLVIEAVFEDLALKQSIFRQLDVEPHALQNGLQKHADRQVIVDDQNLAAGSVEPVSHRAGLPCDHANCVPD